MDSRDSRLDVNLYLNSKMLYQIVCEHLGKKHQQATGFKKNSGQADLILSFQSTVRREC